MAIALITGGGSGIGAATARLMAQQRDTVIVADIDLASADAVAAAIVADGGRAESAHLDVRDADAFTRLAERIVADHGCIDLLFNNAGIGVGGPIEELSAEHWHRIVEVNIMGVVNGIRAVYPHMMAAGDGHIVNTASLAGLVPSPMLAPYALSKHAVVGLSLSLRPEAALHGVRVSTVCPGPTETPILDSTGPADLPPISGISARELLTKAAGGIYPVEDLARDLLKGVRANKALIVAPRRARLAWWAWRLFPAGFEQGGVRLVHWAKRQAERAVVAPAQPPE